MDEAEQRRMGVGEGPEQSAGLVILLSPIGALLVLVAVVVIARGAGRPPAD